jgi:hypothetical protein
MERLRAVLRGALLKYFEAGGKHDCFGLGVWDEMPSEGGDSDASLAARPIRIYRVHGSR